MICWLPHQQHYLLLQPIVTPNDDTRPSGLGPNVTGTWTGLHTWNQEAENDIFNCYIYSY